MAVVFVYGMRRVDPDLYGYLTYGRLFVEHGGLTTEDPFAFTSTGSRWVTFEYLAHIVLWLAYRDWGAHGLIALKCALGGTAVACLYGAVRTAGRDLHVVLPVFAVSASIVSRYFLFRPQLFTFAFFALFVLILFRFLDRRRAPLWVLPVVMLVWTNAHGGFVAGLGAVGLAVTLGVCANAAAGARHVGSLLAGTRPLWLTLGACVLVTFINPQGFHLWGYVLTELTHDTNRRFIAEWQPISLRRDVWSAVGIMLITAALVLLTVSARRAGRPTSGPSPLCWALSCVPIIVLSYLSVRHVPVAALWVAPVLARLAAETPARRSLASPAGIAWAGIWVGGTLGVALTVAAVIQRPSPSIAADGSVLGRTHPCGAVTFMRDNALRGNVYNTLRWGSYITWELYPSVRVAMDGRNISLFPRTMVEENLTFFTTNAGKIDLDVPFRYPSDFLLVPSDMPALSRVLDDRRWFEIFRDDDAILFVRVDEEHAGIIAASTRGALTRPTRGCSPVLE